MPLDIGSGILLTVLVTQLTSLPLNGWTVGLGIVFALLPDIDFLTRLIKRKPDEFSHEHRDLLHSPILFVAIGFSVLAFINLNVTFLFVVCSLAHFLHDSIGMGWGVRWAYPFSKKYYKFFSDRHGLPSRNLIVSWTPAEQKQAAAQFGNPNWMNEYLKFSRELVFELCILTIALVTLMRVTLRW